MISFGHKNLPALIAFLLFVHETTSCDSWCRAIESIILRCVRLSTTDVSRCIERRKFIGQLDLSGNSSSSINDSGPKTSLPVLAVMALSFDRNLREDSSTDNSPAWRFLRRFHLRRSRTFRRFLASILLNNQVASKLKHRTKPILLKQYFDLCRCEWVMWLSTAGDVVLVAYLDRAAACNTLASQECYGTDKTPQRYLSLNATARLLQLGLAYAKSTDSVNTPAAFQRVRRMQKSLKPYDQKAGQLHRVRRVRRAVNRMSEEIKPALESKAQKVKHKSKWLKNIKFPSKPNELNKWEKIKISTKKLNELKRKQIARMLKMKKRNTDELLEHRRILKMQENKKSKAMNKKNKFNLNLKELKKKESKQLQKFTTKLENLKMKTTKVKQLRRHKRNRRFPRKSHKKKKKPKKFKKKRKSKRRKKHQKSKQLRKKQKKSKKQKHKSKKKKKLKKQKHGKTHKSKANKLKGKKKKKKNSNSKKEGETNGSGKEGETNGSEIEEETKDLEKQGVTTDSGKHGESELSEKQGQTKHTTKHGQTKVPVKLEETQGNASSANASNDEEMPGKNETEDNTQNNTTEAVNENLDKADQTTENMTAVGKGKRTTTGEGTPKKDKNHTNSAPEVGEAALDMTTLNTGMQSSSSASNQNPSTIACIILAITTVLMIILYFFFPFKRTPKSSDPNSDSKDGNEVKGSDSATREKYASAKSDSSDVDVKQSSSSNSAVGQSTRFPRETDETAEPRTETDASPTRSASPMKLPQDTSDLESGSNVSPSPSAASAAPVKSPLKKPEESTKMGDKNAASDNSSKKPKKSLIKRLSSGIGRKGNTNTNERHWYEDDYRNNNARLERRRTSRKRSCDNLFDQLLKQRCRSLGESFAYYSLPISSSDSD